ncbi:MAG: glycosyltransferase family 4 protein [bacterium]
MAVTKRKTAPINKKIIIYNKDNILNKYKKISTSMQKGDNVIKKNKIKISKKKLLIGVLSWNSLHGDNEGPYSSHVSEIAAALNRKGHDVHIFTRKNEQKSLKKIDSVFYHFFNIDGSLPLMDRGKALSHSIKKDFFSIEKTKGEFDIVYLYGLEAGLAAKQLMKSRNKKLVLALMDHEMNDSNKSDKIDPLQKGLIDFCDEFILINKAMSQDQKKNYAHLKKKVHFLADGFKSSNFTGLTDHGEIKKRYNLGPVDPIVLFVGSLDYKNGPDIIIDAIPHLLHKHPQLRFIMVGEGELGWNFRIHARYLNFEYALRLLGHKEGWELHELFQACDIIAIPNREFNSPYQVLAGWSAQKPVVVTYEGSYGLINHDKNGLQIYQKPDSFIWAIDTIFSDWDHAYKLAHKGWEIVKDKYSWDSVAQKMLAIY